MFSDSIDLDELLNFYPLTLAGFLGSNNFDKDLLLIFQSISLFEVAYWFILAYLIGKLAKTSLNEGLKLVMSSYFPAFCLWLLAVTFFIVL